MDCFIVSGGDARLQNVTKFLLHSTKYVSHKIKKYKCGIIRKVENILATSFLHIVRWIQYREMHLPSFWSQSISNGHFLLKLHENLLNFCFVLPVFECSIKISATFTKLLYVFDIYRCIPFQQNKFEENRLRRSTRSSQPNQSGFFSRKKTKL